MIAALVVVVCVVLFIILCKNLEDTVNRVSSYQRKTHERISQIEQHEYAQDARLDRHQKAIGLIRADVNEMGKDIGWKDDDRKTRVMKMKERDGESGS